MGNMIMSSREKNSSWSDLPLDLLVLVARKIQNYDDFVAFRGVCVWWRSAVSVEIFNAFHRFPLLLEKIQLDRRFVSCFKTNAICVSKFINGCYAMDSTKAILSAKNSERYCLGWKGWFFVVKKNGNMYLLHVFSRTKIRVPNKNSLKSWTRDGLNYFVYKAALSADPRTAGSDFTLMISFEWDSLVAFWRPGYEKFTTDHIYSVVGGVISFRPVVEVLFHNGFFYSLSGHGVSVFDVKGTQLIKPTHRLHRYDPMYLVESAGELLIVLQANYLRNSVTRFGVFVYKPNDQWEEVNNVGNRALFVGRNNSFSVDASKIKGCKANHIYFAGDDRFWKRRWETDYVVAYNLLDRTLEYYRHRSNKQQSMWLTRPFFS